MDRVGKFEAAYASAPVKLDATYTTPDQSHAMMEPHASIAAWNGDELTVWTSNQMIDWGRGDLAKTLGMPKAKVRLISPYVGGGFGGKLFLRSDAIMAALGAKAAKRPVKVALPRPFVINNTTHRPATRQRILDAGAAYLAWLGWRMLRSQRRLDLPDAGAVPGEGAARSLFVRSFLYPRARLDVSAALARQAPGQQARQTQVDVPPGKRMQVEVLPLARAVALGQHHARRGDARQALLRQQHRARRLHAFRIVGANGGAAILERGLRKLREPEGLRRLAGTRVLAACRAVDDEHSRRQRRVGARERGSERGRGRGAPRTAARPASSRADRQTAICPPRSWRCCPPARRLSSGGSAAA